MHTLSVYLSVCVRAHTDVQQNRLMLCRTMQPEYKPAKHLSVVKCASNRRLISRFRTGCHGLRVDTGRWAHNIHLDRTDRLCQVCKSLDCVEDEQQYIFFAQRTAISGHSI